MRNFRAALLNNTPGKFLAFAKDFPRISLANTRDFLRGLVILLSDEGNAKEFPRICQGNPREILGKCQGFPKNFPRVFFKSSALFSCELAWRAAALKLQPKGKKELKGHILLTKTQ